MYIHTCIGTSHEYTYVLKLELNTVDIDCLIHLYMYEIIPLTHPSLLPQLLVDADILPTLLLLLDHSNSAVQTNAAWALMVRE